MRNFVAKHDFNRGGFHKSSSDYTRITNNALVQVADEALDELFWEEECNWMDWESQWDEEDF